MPTRLRSLWRQHCWLWKCKDEKKMHTLLHKYYKSGGLLQLVFEKWYLKNSAMLYNIIYARSFRVFRRGTISPRSLKGCKIMSHQIWRSEKTAFTAGLWEAWIWFLANVIMLQICRLITLQPLKVPMWYIVCILMVTLWKALNPLLVSTQAIMCSSTFRKCQQNLVLSRSS